MKLPLEGLRIVSVEQFGAGPYGTTYLGELGAEVIKVENPSTGGDPARLGDSHRLGQNDSQYFQSWNSNKRSVALDLKSAEGRRDFEALVARADALVNNLRGDLPAALKLTYRDLAPLNPSIVCLHISAYGRDNSRTARPGYDFLMQAEAGLMSLTGDPEGSPARFGPSIVDYMTGVTAMTGLLSAIIGAQRTGIGCDVDTSLYEVAMHTLGYAATWYLNDGEVTTRLARSSHFGVAPSQTFRAKDGWFFLMCMTEKFWQVLADLLRRPEVTGDADFATPALRFQHRAKLTLALDSVFIEQPVQHWIEVLGKRLPIGPVQDVAQALDSDFTREIGMVVSVPHPAKADLRLLANPIRIDGRRLPKRACPQLGADSAALLGKPAARGVT